MLESPSIATEEPAVDAPALAEAYRPFARSLARRYARTAPWLADELQSIAVDALVRAAGNFDAARGKFPTHAAVGIHCALSRRVGRERRRNPAAFRPQYDAEHHPLSLCPARPGPEPGSALDVAAVLALLEPDQRELVGRVVLQGDSLEEIARECGVSRQAIYGRLGRALARLRAQPLVQGMTARG